MNAVTETFNIFAQYVEEPAFSYGAVFVVFCFLSTGLLELAYSLCILSFQRRTRDFCNHRFSGLLDAPCRVHSCPHHGSCPFYTPRRSVKSLLADFMKKKNKP